MELARFRRLLDIHGADIRSWPAAERRAARRLLAASTEAARARDEAAQLDRLFRSAHAAASEASVQRVLDGLAPPRRQAVAEAPFERPWTSTVFLAGMAALGVVVALFDLAPLTTAPSDFVALMFDTGLVQGLGW
jgi:ferric-dicitrate binding protein FerR (iron transport regulator)